MEWFVARNGESFGPFSVDTLVNGARTGQLRKDDWVWRAGLNDWVSAGSVSDLWPRPDGYISTTTTYKPLVAYQPQDPATERQGILLVPFVIGVFASVLLTISIFMVKDWTLARLSAIGDMAAFFNLF